MSLCEENSESRQEDEGLISAIELERGKVFAGKRDEYPPWLFGHPKGLYVLAATEVWERFGFYGMRSLLILYMTQELFLPERRGGVWGLGMLAGAEAEDVAPQVLASRVYGLYTSAAYLVPIAGGFVADHYIGRRRTVMAGAALMSLGYLLLAASPNALLGALALVAVGSGALKPNVSSQIGSMYDSWDSRKSTAFLIFYCGINLGAFLSPIVSGVLHATLGFGAGFLASSVAVLFGLAQYLAGMRHTPPDWRDAEGRRARSLSGHGKGAEDPRGRAPFLQRLAMHRGRLTAIVLVCLLTVGFWSVYEQQGNTLPIFADQEVALHLGPVQVPTEFVQSINPLFIIAFTPLLSAFWRRQAKFGHEPSSLTKMSMGCLILSLCYVWLAAAVWLTGPSEKVGPGHLVVAIALATVGELYLAPVGLAFVSETAPEDLTAFVMGLWFIASSIGFYVCGALGTLYSWMLHGSFFGMLAAIAAVNGLLLMIAKGVLQRALQNS
eukprot:CAMPEP_0177588398 /NCGR_PEP_ID=MMETSP0419_2-20121207/6203_1 /TAXON_ID=582737 /ORGANISM="Tetraselmis sp., Strain GSL018" /LENGTH=495 /DNA_ID=CAMNT_0019078591 /DNA_START=293 /DNA_END=1780 /DNA_ORIENTATION=+